MYCLRYLADKIQGGYLPPRDWIDCWGPRLPGLLLALSLPFLLSGVVRTVLHLALPASLVLSSVACLAMFVLLVPWLRGKARPSGSWVIELVGLLPIAFAVWTLYHPDFGGFPNLDGWDGGNHVYIKDRFASVEPGIYNGQITYYALTWWLEKLFGLDSFRSFTVAFYFLVVVTLSLSLLITFTFLHGKATNRAALWASVAVAVLGSCGVSWLVVLPLYHYNQGAGYYVHLFGLLPLMLLWAADACIRLQMLRILALLAALALLRFTYALNLADTIVAVAFVLVCEGFRGRWRIAQGLLVAGLCAAAFLVVVELRPIFKMWGGMQRFDVGDVQHANLTTIIIATLTTTIAAWTRLPWDFLRSRLFRTLRFPLAFAAANSGFFQYFRQGKGLQYYYLTKYQIWGSILVAFVAVIVLSHLVLVLLERASWRRPRVFMLAAAVGVMCVMVPKIWATTFIKYRNSLFERMRPHSTSYKSLRPLADVVAIKRIKTILAEKDKKFGGYLTSFFPMFSFMNGVLGRHAGYQEFFPPATERGYCVFWVGRDRDTYPLGPTRILDAIRNRVAAQGFTCEEYPVPWKSTPQSLCHRCF
jgi:hypothetical protein